MKPRRLNSAIITNTAWAKATVICLPKSDQSEVIKIRTNEQLQSLIVHATES
jgi:hypothetical protein